MTANRHNPSPARQLRLRVELSGCADKDTLLTRLALDLRFPGWFGHNWDALADCLTDLSWLPAGDIELTLANPATLQAADPEVWATLLGILNDTATFWAGEGRRFTCSPKLNPGVASE